MHRFEGTGAITAGVKSDKELYRSLRELSRDELWKVEVARFNRAPAQERRARVAVIRAVGVAFAGQGAAAAKAGVREWLLGLLKDPDEKVRRYAMAAIPKLGATPDAESGVLDVLKAASGDRERRHAGRVLDKIGGAETLTAIAAIPGALGQTEQRVRAAMARAEQPGRIALDRPLRAVRNLRIHLRCRKGLESFVLGELREALAAGAPFRVIETRPRYVAIEATAPFALGDLYRMRCFATVGFALGIAQAADARQEIEAVARMITSPVARDLFGAFTEGAWRYRVEFVSKGHQRGAVKRLANRAYELRQDILNDPRRAPWSMDVHSTHRGTFVEMRPRLHPDPRMAYRTDDVPAASHPPLAACMARLAGSRADEVVWDPFCGSGLELVERALRGGVTRVIGTDTSAEAIGIAKANVAAAKLRGVTATFAACDFRDWPMVDGLGPGRVSLVVTNPPMGRRVRIPNLHLLIGDLFRVASRMLVPGGRLVFVNPLKIEPSDPTLRFDFAEVVDLGGFDARLEKYVKVDAPSRRR